MMGEKRTQMVNPSRWCAVVYCDSASAPVERLLAALGKRSVQTMCVKQSRQVMVALAQRKANIVIVVVQGSDPEDAATLQLAIRTHHPRTLIWRFTPTHDGSLGQLSSWDDTTAKNQVASSPETPGADMVSEAAPARTPSARVQATHEAPAGPYRLTPSQAAHTNEVRTQQLIAGVIRKQQVPSTRAPKVQVQPSPRVTQEQVIEAPVVLTRDELDMLLGPLSQADGESET